MHAFPSVHGRSCASIDNRRDGARLEPLQPDRLATFFAEPVASGLQPKESLVYLADQFPRTGPGVLSSSARSVSTLARSVYIGFVNAALRQTFERSVGFLEKVRPPADQLLSEILGLPAIHEIFVFGRSIVGRQGQHHWTIHLSAARSSGDCRAYSHGVEGSPSVNLGGPIRDTIFNVRRGPARPSREPRPSRPSAAESRVSRDRASQRVPRIDDRERRPGRRPTRSIAAGVSGAPGSRSSAYAAWRVTMIAPVGDRLRQQASSGCNHRRRAWLWDLRHRRRGGPIAAANDAPTGGKAGPERAPVVLHLRPVRP